ncbi:MAG: YdcF family protein, partial [Acidimicrobiales bacterium]
MLLTVDVLVGAAGAATVATRRPILHPRLDTPVAAEAVVVLSGDYGDRLAAGLDLMARRVAPTLVLAGEPDYLMVIRLCQNPQPFEAVCLLPQPDSTRAEARAVADLAAQRGWRRVVVVTSMPHVTRARLLFERCVEGEVLMVGSHPPPQARG